MIALAVVAALVSAGDNRAFSRAELGLEPVRAYTDIGPVVVRRTSNANKLRRELQVIADRLGADGFFVEQRDPFLVYGEEASHAPTKALGDSEIVPGSKRDRTAADADVFYLVGAAVGTVYDLFKTKVDNRAFLRAYTYRELPQATRDELLTISRRLVMGQITPVEADAQRLALLSN